MLKLNLHEEGHDLQVLNRTIFLYSPGKKN